MDPSGMRHDVMTLSEEERKQIGLWAADCAERVLPLFEAKAPADTRPHQAIESFRVFARGQMRKGELRAALGAAYAAAREVGDSCAAAAARAAGLVAGIPYMHARITLDQAKHVLGPAMYAARARDLAAGNDPRAGDEEIRWAITHASSAVRDALRRMPERGPSAFNGAYDIRLVFGLNNKGLIVGAGFDYDAHSGSPSWTEHYQPLVYCPGQTGSVLAVSSQALGGAAYAVNDRGLIVGCEFMSNALPRAVQWVDGAIAPISGLTSATESVAFDVCEEGTVAGMKKVDGQWQGFLADASGSSLFAPATINDVNFREFWHVGKFGALSWGAGNTSQRLYWVFPDDDQDDLSDILEQEIVDADPFDSIVSNADVLGSDDFDGDGLTNAQEWAAKTDPTRKDTDGDRIPDGADPLPLTWRDTDGDGLPDDWETFYGLNPLSTNGMHGASGDPDGDGFTNIEEYRLGSSPTSSAGLGYVFHRGKIGQLQVVIQDSTNCAGNNDSRQFVQRTIQYVEITNANMRPMEFTFKVSVTGRVERQNSGYDLVRVNNELVFKGSGEGLKCQMANKSADVLVKVQAPPGEITLSYDTVDSLFHVGAFAKATDVEMIDVNTNILKVEFEARAGKINYGFDPKETVRDDSLYAWASVDKDDTSDVSMINIEPSAAAEEIELVIVSGNGSADISPKTFTAGSTDLTITGQGAVGNALVEARIGSTGPACQKLNIMALPKRGPIEIGIYRISDSTSAGTAFPGDVPSNADILDTVNCVFEQAQVSFSLHTSSGSYDVEYDTVTSPFTNGMWTSGSDGKWQLPEEDAYLDVDPSPWTAPIKIFLIRANGDSESFVYDPPYDAYFVRGFAAGLPLHSVIFTDGTSGQTALVVAHEIGHILGLAVYNDDGGHDSGPWPDGEEHLIRSGQPSGPVGSPTFPVPGEWLRHEDWKKANDEAGAL